MHTMQEEMTANPADNAHLADAGEVMHIAAFYRFVQLPDYKELQPKLLAFCNAHGMKGTILLAEEGINSTISATPENLKAFFAFLDEDPRLANMPYKLHEAEYKPFGKMKVRLKKEIVRLDVPGIMHVAPEKTGTYVKSEDWDALISDPEVITIDTRNRYEIQLGTFEGAVDPMTDDFRHFPEWVEQHLDPEKHKKVAMYCTGGIRCEKSTAYLKSLGFEEVFHLEGGILQYLEDTENQNGKWQGECFVFDDRVAVNDRLEPSPHLLCKSCGQPVASKGAENENTQGVRCEECASNI